MNENNVKSLTPSMLSIRLLVMLLFLLSLFAWLQKCAFDVKEGLAVSPLELTLDNTPFPQLENVIVDRISLKGNREQIARGVLESSWKVSQGWAQAIDLTLPLELVSRVDPHFSI